MMLETIKVLFLLLVQTVENLFQRTTTRYIIKNYISPTEIPMWKWFTWTFISQLGWKQVLGLAGIASFTLITFPLGVWLASFQAGLFYPLSSLLGMVLTMVGAPLQLWMFHKTVGEITFNRPTITGLALVEVSCVIAIVGWWLILQGNQ